MKKNVKVIYFLLVCVVLSTSIIGATYAYWTASTHSEMGAVNTKSKTYSINLEITPVPLYSGFSFIPMNDADVVKALNHSCKDKYDRGACSAYYIRVYDYDEKLDFISGTMDIFTNNMENLSYMVLEESTDDDEDSCVTVEDKNYCISHEVTHMGDGSNLSLGSSYSVSGLDEKNLLLVVWLTNLTDRSQNSLDIGNFNATVTIHAGDGGEIKGTIASSVVIEPDDNNDNAP